MPRPYQAEFTFEGLSDDNGLSEMTSPTSARVGDGPNPVQGVIRPDRSRPCDVCRRRKSRCVINPDAAACVMCQFHNQPCTFIEEAAPRRRKQTDPPDTTTTGSARRS